MRGIGLVCFRNFPITYIYGKKKKKKYGKRRRTYAEQKFQQKRLCIKEKPRTVYKYIRINKWRNKYKRKKKLGTEAQKRQKKEDKNETYCKRVKENEQGMVLIQRKQNRNNGTV